MSKMILGIVMSLVCSLAIPAGSLHEISGHSLSIVVTVTETDLSVGLPMFGCFTIPVSGLCLVLAKFFLLFMEMIESRLARPEESNWDRRQAMFEFANAYRLTGFF